MNAPMNEEGLKCLYPDGFDNMIEWEYRRDRNTWDAHGWRVEKVVDTTIITIDQDDVGVCLKYNLIDEEYHDDLVDAWMQKGETVVIKEETITVTLKPKVEEGVIPESTMVVNHEGGHLSIEQTREALASLNANPIVGNSSIGKGRGQHFSDQRGSQTQGRPGDTSQTRTSGTTPQGDYPPTITLKDLEVSSIRIY